MTKSRKCMTYHLAVVCPSQASAVGTGNTVLLAVHTFLTIEAVAGLAHFYSVAIGGRSSDSKS